MLDAVLNGKTIAKMMNLVETYTCPRCGFEFKLELERGESFRKIKCLECEKDMKIHNRFQISASNLFRKKVHYLHKSLLN